MKLALGLGINARAENLEGMGGFNINNLSPQIWLAFNTGQGNIADGIRWNDQSTNENHASQTNDDHEGAFSSGFYRTDAGANDHLEFATQVDLTGAYYVFMAIDLSEQTDEPFLSSTNSSTSFMRLGQGSDTNFRLRHNTASNQIDISMSAAFGTDLAIFEVKRDQSNNITVFKNGTQVGTASSQAGTFEANQISAHSNGLSSANIAEVVVFNKLISSGDATNVRNDIADRNSITL